MAEDSPTEPEADFADRPRVLIDRPAKRPALGCSEIADGLASIIKANDPGFAVGIFGDWGSGKTTLMQAIRSRLTQSGDAVVTLDFNAWRYERERELLIPLLDTVRQGLVDWAQERSEPQDVDRVREAARRIGRVVRALVAGVSVEVGVGAKVSYDAGAVLADLDAGDNRGEHAQSLYFAGFRELAMALDEVSEAGIHRIVIFVDDLDRCVPSTAFDVLDAIKMFFDLPGFIFVVGLDEEVIESAVRMQYWPVVLAQAIDTAVGPAGSRDIDVGAGREHVDKLFQVQHCIAPVVVEQLDELLGAMFDECQLRPSQVDDIATRVRPYLPYLETDGRVNPRRVKRFINAYIVQALARPGLDPQVVVALQTIAWRSEWEFAWELLQRNAGVLISAIYRYRDGDGGALQAIWPRVRAVPRDFAAYALSREIEPVLTRGPLLPYVTALRSSRIQWALPANLLDEVRALEGIANDIRRLAETGAGDRVRLASELAVRIEHLGSYLLRSPIDQEPLERALSFLSTMNSAAYELAQDEEHRLHEIPFLASEIEANVANLRWGIEQSLQWGHAEAFFGSETFESLRRRGAR